MRERESASLESLALHFLFLNVITDLANSQQFCFQDNKHFYNQSEDEELRMMIYIEVQPNRHWR